ncbi:kinase-like domain-containing protein [Paraphoma chrysanthemicola]|uniref:non-specific serine/threonine protein kinase n=1 Tax=Paraphoma chrysanthemicola TaxID=798071 RepID=A0A8K0VVT4_9PLEO|nr:kinase-like domain-containing protein [Paraphoma chrysanthemicola]
MAHQQRTALSQSTHKLRIDENTNHENVQEAQLPYIHERPVGRGGYGVVDAVRDIHTGRVFARKIFHTTSKRRERVRAMQEFHHEAKQIRKLAQNHHMVRIHATYATKDSLGLILSPMANEGDLAKFLDRFSDLSDEQNTTRQQMTYNLMQAFGCLSSGLAFMRRQKIRHKDIKPSNILIHNGRVLYTDFGLALDFSNLDTSMTTGPAERTTRKYSAPEVILHQPRRSSADVYSLGCVFIEMYNIVLKFLDYDERLKYSDSMDSIRTQISARVAQYSTAPRRLFLIGFDHSSHDRAEPRRSLLGG